MSRLIYLNVLSIITDSKMYLNDPVRVQTDTYIIFKLLSKMKIVYIFKNSSFLQFPYNAL